MSFFKFSESIEIGEIGEFPQSPKMVNGYNVESEDSLYKVNWNERIPNQPNLISFELSRKARLTDVISSVTVNSQAALLISNDLLNFFKGYNLPNEVQCFNAAVIHGSITHEDYHLLFVYERGLDFIDFSNSYFERKSFFDYRKVSNVQFQSKYDYLEKLEIDKITGDLCSYEPLKLSLLLHEIPYDLVRISLGINGYLVSSRLSESLRRSTFTGFELASLDRFDFIFKS